MDKREPIMTQVSPQMKKKILAYSKRNECTVAQVVRLALVSFFEKSYNQSEAKPTR